VEIVVEISATEAVATPASPHSPPTWRLPPDARVFQIAFQATLLTVGVLARDFALDPRQMALAFAAGLLAQHVWLRALGLEHKGLLSALVTCLGVSLLLRADSLWVHPLAAALAISSKFVLRVDGRHVFNPANLGVIAALVLLPGTWVSAGQWGNDVMLAVVFVALGALVTERARRGDIAWIFLASWLALLAARAAWLGQTWTVVAHQLANGGLLLFAFFMISDPMTIPKRRAARAGYAFAVAAFAFAWQFALFRTNGLLWALFLLSPLAPLIDRYRPGPAFAWRPEHDAPAPLPTLNSARTRAGGRSGPASPLERRTRRGPAG
jgi:Na+-transporting NADH:ubiquinone oxidoreductase subunit NqrB